MTILGKNIKITTIILLFLSLSLTSCFDIIQDLAIKKNGSGKLALTINFSKSKTQLEQLLSQSSIYGFEIPSIHEIDKKLALLKTELTKCQGISNVQISKDFEHYIFKLHCDFIHIDNIAQIQYALMPNHQEKEQFLTYSYHKNKFNCTYSTNLLNEASHHLKTYGISDLGSADVISILHFDKTIQECSSTSCQVSKNNLSVFDKMNAATFIKNAQNHSHTVIFK